MAKGFFTLCQEVQKIHLITSGSIRTYFKALKARKKRASTQQMVEGDPQITNKVEESEVTPKRNQRCHNVSE